MTLLKNELKFTQHHQRHLNEHLLTPTLQQIVPFGNQIESTSDMSGLLFAFQIGNHDRSRVASRFRSELVDAFNMLILLLPGIAITYMVNVFWS